MSQRTRSQLEVDGLTIAVIRSRRRTLSLEVDHQGVCARAPLRLALRDIKQFVRLRRDWIDNTLAALPKIPDPLKLQNGSQIPLNGDWVRLQLDTGRSPGRLVEHPLQHVILPVPKSHLPYGERVRRKLVRWYRQTALEQLTLIMHQEASRMQSNLASPTLKVRDYKRRWGSCDTSGNLGLNWRLIMAPVAVQRYVVQHELAHRQEFNHSPQFWRLVEQRDPNYSQQRDWLHQQGHTLYRI